tara:strand:+ start:1543 stop:1818 length:276 start_codon:yes stop_codon:yes gene_type:complete
MEKINKILESADFVFAKTMPSNPHSYTLKEKWEDKELFNEVVMYIRDNGLKERFYSKTYTYYYLNGYKYWTMGNSLEITRLINRATAMDDD